MADENTNATSTIKAEPSWFGGTTYRIPARAEPSFWGEDTSFGISVGALAALTLGSYLGGGFLVYAGFLAAGAVVGGFFNKQRMEKELAEGKKIEKPGFFNRGLIEGALHGVGLVKLVALVPNMIATGLGATLLFNPALPMAMAVMAAAGVIGAIRGAMKREDEQEKVYEFVENSYSLQNGLPMKEHGKGLSQYIAPAAGIATVVAAGIPGMDASGLHGLFSEKAGAALAETAGDLASKQQTYPDFSEIENHPANRAQAAGFSFADAELQRRGAKGIATPQAADAARELNTGRFADRLSDQRVADAVASLQGNQV